MKILISIIFLFSILNVSYSQDFYYYKGNRITLEERTDKAVVVYNSNFISKEQKISDLSGIISPDYDVKEISENVYLINFNKFASINEIRNLNFALPSQSNLVKLVAPAYFGESKKVTQLPTDEFIVRLRNLKDKEKLEILNAENNISIIGNVGSEKGFLLKSDNNIRKNALELSDIYYRAGIFEYAEPNFLYPEGCTLTMNPNDQFYPLQWALNNTGQSVPTGGDSTNGDFVNINGIPNCDIDANLAWDITTGSPSIKIAIVDTGIDSTHPDFNVAGHLTAGYDAVFNKYGVPKDSGIYGGHGTCTAGLAGARINNGIGIAGVAPTCKLMAIRIFNTELTSTVIGIGRAFDTAVVAGVDVISNSWNGGTPSTTVTNAINNAALNGRGGLGCVILITSGNDGRNALWFPSYLPNVIAVGASTPHDQKKAPGTGNEFWWGANYGENENGDLDIVAPTVCYTTDIQGAFGYNNLPGTDGDFFKFFNGTSCACPQVSGIAALVLSINPSLTRIEVNEKLYRGCDKIDNAEYSVNKPFGKWNAYFGYGRANAYNSVRLAAGIDITPPTINHKNIYSHQSTYPTFIEAEIIDQDGSAVPSTGDNQPKLLYRTNKLEAGWSLFDSVHAIVSTGNIFKFMIPCQGYETQIQYYITAKDNQGNIASFPRSAPNNFWLCYFAIGNLQYERMKINGFSCAPNGVTYSPTVNFSNFRILNTKVELFLRHNNIKDEIIQLYSPGSDPSNNRKCLFASDGGNGMNITGAIVTDNAERYWGAGSPPYQNELFKASYLLNGLNGTNALGGWKILNYDQFDSNAATYDSVIINFTRTAGIASSSARHDSPSDTILNFGIINYPDSVVKNFYIKNVGTDTLRVNGVYFTGTYSYKFSLLNLAPININSDDSALFFVLMKTNTIDSSALTTGSDNYENAVMNFNTDDPSKPVFRVSLQSENIIPDVKKLFLKVLIQGFYNSMTHSTRQDTVRVYLHDSIPPYNIIDSSASVIDTTGWGTFDFLNASNGRNYFLRVSHRNSIKTWSALPGQMFTSNILSYDMTTDTIKAVGYNLTRVDNNPLLYAIYNGDINQDGLVDGSDMLLVDNDAVFLVKGYVPTDVNGDGFVDGTDALITSNNTAKYIVEITP